MFFSLCVFCSYSCLYECRLCVVCAMHAYVCILFAFVFVFLLLLLFFILVFNFVLFCFVFFFLLLFQRKALVLFACALYVCVLSSLVYARVRADCPRACWLPKCARANVLLFFLYFIFMFFLFRCECLCARCACVLLQSTCVCTYVRCACTLSKQALYARVCVLTAHVRAHQCSFIF